MNITAEQIKQQYGLDQRTWPEEVLKLFKNSVRIRQGFEGMMLDRIGQMNKETFELARQTREGTIGHPSPEGSSGKDNDVGVNVGDVTTITINGYQPPNTTQTPTEPVKPVEQPLPAVQEPPEVQQPPPIQQPVVQQPQPIVIPIQADIAPIKPIIIPIKTEVQHVVQPPQVIPSQPIQPVKPAEPIKEEIPVATDSSNSGSAPASAPTSSATIFAPWTRSGVIPTLVALAAGVGGIGLGAYLMKQPPAPVVVQQPNRPEEKLTIPPPEKPVQQPGLGGWKLGANPYRVTPEQEKQNVRE